MRVALLACAAALSSCADSKASPSAPDDPRARDMFRGGIFGGVVSALDAAEGRHAVEAAPAPAPVFWCFDGHPFGVCERDVSSCDDTRRAVVEATSFVGTCHPQEDAVCLSGATRLQPARVGTVCYPDFASCNAIRSVLVGSEDIVAMTACERRGRWELRPRDP